MPMLSICLECSIQRAVVAVTNVVVAVRDSILATMTAFITVNRQCDQSHEEKYTA